MKRLLEINVSANTGSTGRIAEEIGRLATANNFDSYIAYGRVNNQSQLKTIRIGCDWDFKMHALQSRLLDNHGFASRHATRKFLQQLDQIKPDIIHLHNIHGYYINIEYLFEYLKDVGIPVVWTLHDCWPITGHCAHFDYFNCGRWKTRCHDCPNIQGYPKSIIIDRSERNFEIKRNIFTSIRDLAIVTPSIWLKNIVKESFLKDFPIYVINNGVDLNVFKPCKDLNTLDKYRINDKKKIILGVASIWNRKKGLTDFLKLSSILNDDCQIVLVGLSEKQLYDLPSNITGLRRTENVKELAQLYSSADVFVNPTYVDNFPTTNIEALACGTPVVTYRTGGSPEAVDQNTGYVVEKSNIDMLGYAIKEILSKDPAKIERACRQRAVELYDKNERFMDYINLYNSVIG